MAQMVDEKAIAQIKENEEKNAKRKKFIRNAGFVLLAAGAGVGAYFACEALFGEDGRFSGDRSNNGGSNNGGSSDDAALAATYDYSGV